MLCVVSALSMTACADPNAIYVDTNAYFAPFEYFGGPDLRLSRLPQAVRCHSRCRLRWRPEAGAYPTEEQYAICVTKGNTELLDAINSVLAGLGEAGINALVAKQGVPRMIVTYTLHIAFGTIAHLLALG